MSESPQEDVDMSCCDMRHVDVVVDSSLIESRSRLKLGSLIHGSICTCTFGNVVKVVKICFLSMIL